MRYSNEPIHRLLKEYHLKIRSISEAKEKFKISRKELRDLYYYQKFSMDKIAKKYTCSHATIVNRMKKYGLKSRGHLGLTKPIRISKENLEYLYHKRGLSLGKIAKILHCSKGGIEGKIKKLGIKTRSINNRACKYKKYNFNGTLKEKAYMIGFRLGDLNLSKKRNVIIARCSTTKQAQASLIKKLFLSYGGVKISKSKRGTFEINVFLNESFNFLLPKKDSIPNWIIKNKKYLLPFFAGYADAEGSLYTHKAKNQSNDFSTFEITSYDKTILKLLWENFKKIDIISPYPTITHPAGRQCGNKNYFSNQDAWSLIVAQKKSLWKLTHLWEKYSKHKDKKKAINRAKKNLILRNQRPYCHKINLSIPKTP